MYLLTSNAHTQAFSYPWYKTQEASENVGYDIYLIFFIALARDCLDQSDDPLYSIIIMRYNKEKLCILIPLSFCPHLAVTR